MSRLRRDIFHAPQAERLRLEYDRMEDWKESRCRCCPKCGRVVEKLSGCDLMVCGTFLIAWLHAKAYNYFLTGGRA